MAVLNHHSLSYLRSLRNTIAHDLQPELRSGHARDLADHAVMLLNQMITELEVGPTLTAQHAPAWSGLTEQFTRLSSSQSRSSASPGPPNGISARCPR